MDTETSLVTERMIYPQSDGQPIADNTRQFQWIVTIKEGLEALFHEREDVFVAGDLLWYAVEGRPKIRTAPDVLVVFGRPKGHRGSYLQWKEEGIAPQAVFEILSPGNLPVEMKRKYRFYTRYGVEEYYLYDPDQVSLKGWQRKGDRLIKIKRMNGWVSPRLGIRFEMGREEMELYRPDGERFLTYVELMGQREKERDRAEQERQRAVQERQRAEQERQRAVQERQRAERLAAQLRALGIKPEGENAE
jgi:Uma2 family endonuclease